MRPSKPISSNDLDLGEELINVQHLTVREAAKEVSIIRAKALPPGFTAKQWADARVSHATLVEAVKARQKTESSENPEFAGLAPSQETPVDVEPRWTESQEQVQEDV